mgnify:CR=1 FL=1
MAENVLDEVRLAVSEACSLAVRQHRAYAPTVPVELRLTDEADRFRIQVADAVWREQPAGDSDGEVDLSEDDASGVGELATALGPDDAGQIDLAARERIGLAVIRGLVDDVQVEYLGSGSVVSMTWPIEAGPAGAYDSGPSGASSGAPLGTQR